MTDSRLCGAYVVRCGDCSNAVAKPLGACPKCGSAVLRPDTCRNRAVRSGRCRLHGASLPQVKHKAAVADVEADIHRFMADHGWQPCDNPTERLAELVGEVLAFKDAAGEQVDKLRSLTVEDQLGRQDAAALLQVYERALDRANRILVDDIKLGLEERRVRLSEQQASLVSAVIERVLMSAGVDTAAVDVRSRVAAELRALEVGS